MDVSNSVAQTPHLSFIPFDIVRAGLHWSRRMSKQILPLELILGW
jgi:hypothetical protein